ncbi:cupin-like domain-containing protein [Pyxidicoccus fallax]|uniref:Cupin-like domain-containing protein n=1 Tax=Pyxidicoccus fallax TaxID=394095 RepID=A0A848L923_9BACT|nr:cupin-like domain-containing protein [Pyxidicoccus fallax]NMO15057.1 cupin-like domain-containing protein [Pyxidicoccus fallax]NPC78255.1 cupin-like domain-containing protein [Pyxidicoccus fallax]
MTEATSTLAPEWRAWLAENLVLGVAPERLEGTLVSSGVSPDVARTEVASAREHPAVEAGRQRARLHGRVRSLLDSRVALHRQGGWHQRLERRRGVSARELMERYYLAHRPVILEDFMDGWPVLERWQPRALAERFGDVEVEVMAGRESRADHDLEPEACRTLMRFGEFIRRLLEGGPSNDLYLTARNFALERPELRALMEDLRYPAGVLRETNLVGAVKLWVGPRGTKTALHHDLGTVFFGQIAGRKRFRLIPSFQTHQLYSQRDVWSQVDADRPDLERFPLYREADVLETVVEPGEMLLIPAGWWHQVTSLDVSVSVTFQEFDVPGGNTWWRLR